MASQITHIVLADKMRPSLFAQYEPGAFFAGNIFPDIRYLKVIDREATHPHVRNLQDILDEPDPFVAGMKLHQLVDLVRERFMRRENVYDLCPPSEFSMQTLKIYEDQKYYSNIADWPGLIKGLDYRQAGKFGIPPEKIGLWYDSMKEYFSAPPTSETRKAMMLKLGFVEQVVDKMLADVDAIKASGPINQKLDEFYEEAEDMIRKANYK